MSLRLTYFKMDSGSGSGSSRIFKKYVVVRAEEDLFENRGATKHRPINKLTRPPHTNLLIWSVFGGPRILPGTKNIPN